MRDCRVRFEFNLLEYLFSHSVVCQRTYRFLVLDIFDFFSKFEKWFAYILTQSTDGIFYLDLFFVGSFKEQKFCNFSFDFLTRRILSSYGLPIQKNLQFVFFHFDFLDHFGYCYTSNDVFMEFLYEIRHVPIHLFSLNLPFVLESLRRRGLSFSKIFGYYSYINFLVNKFLSCPSVLVSARHFLLTMSTSLSSRFFKLFEELTSCYAAFVYKILQTILIYLTSNSLSRFVCLESIGLAVLHFCRVKPTRNLRFRLGFFVFQFVQQVFYHYFSISSKMDIIFHQPVDSVSLSSFSCVFPMRIIPCNWPNGGFLLYKSSLVKKSMNVLSTLDLSQSILHQINRQQKVSFKLDKDLFIFYQSISFFGDISDLQKKLDSVCCRIKLWYSSGSGLRMHLASFLREKKRIERSMQKVIYYKRILNNLAVLFVDFQCFYYPYELDFRMRLYPIPGMLSPMGSSLVRSLILFGTGKPFQLSHFIRYSCRQYSSCTGLSDVSLETFFWEVVEPVLRRFSPLEIFSRVREPFLFFACAQEWFRYLSSSNKSNYITFFPVYLDCSNSGYQITSLLFRLHNYKKSLNLCSQTSSSLRGDLYFSLVSDFGYDVRFRDIFKPNIISFLFGISFYRFTRLFIESAFDRLELLPSGDYSYLRGISVNFWRFLCGTAFSGIRDHFTKLSSAVAWSFPGYVRFRYVYMCRQKSFIRLSAHKVLVSYRRNRINYVQNKFALFPNLIQSIESFILFLCLEHCPFGFFTIHDNFGIHMVYINYFRDIIKIVYSIVLEVFSTQFGDLSYKDILSSFYMTYYN